MALTQTLRVVVTLNPLADSENRIINTWHIATRDATTPSQAFDSFTAALNTFYQAVDTHFSTEVSGAVPDMYGWNYIEPKPRQPFDYFQATPLVAAANRTARELCCVLSYKANYESGITPKRRRGRIFLGPLADTAVDSSTGRLSGTTVSAVATAADTLVTASAASSLWAWVVYSPTTDVTGTGETGMYEVIGGWVDDNPDIQRRRSSTGGARTTWS
jgi:hypothetical protein